MAKYLDLDGLTRYNNKVNTKLDTKANVDGAYELMTVGNAEQLIASTTVEDKSPYLFRTSGGSLDIGDRLNLKSIVGGSVAFNQLVQNGNFVDTSGWSAGNATLSATNNVASVVATNNGTAIIYKSVKITNKEHKNLVICQMKATAGKTLYISGISRNATATASGSWQTLAYFETGENSAYPRFGLQSVQANDTVEIKNIQSFDLTQMFGSAIADYIYSLEQATAGSGVAYFRSLFPKDYYDYNAGQLMSVKALSHKTVGFNQWDEEWRNGYYNTTGKFVTHANNVSNKNPIAVIPNTTYYLHIETSANGGFGRLCFYDKNGVFVSTQSITGNKNYLLTIPSNAYYLNFDLQATYGKVYNNDICINLHWDGERDGEYEAYSERIYPLDSDLELRGIPKLDANNNLYYDGDTYESDGTVTRKYGIVDLGELNWSKDAYNRFYSSGISTIAPPNNNTIANIITYKYETATSNQVADKDKTIGISSGGVLQVKDLSYEYVSDFKTAMSGVYLVYELATPTTETADTFQNLQIVDDFGTEEFVDSRDVPIPVGHLTDYYPDLRAKLEMTPNSPDGNGDYLVRQTNGINEYVEYVSPIPTPPTTDGTYVLKATVSSGVATLSWVAE